MSENRSEWALGYARRKLPFHSRENEVSSERNRRASCGMDGAAFPRSFFPLDLTRISSISPSAFRRAARKKAFTPCLMREEAVNRMFKPEGAGDLPFLLGRDRQCLGSQLLYYIMYVLLILFRIIGTCTVDQDTSGFQGVPDIMDDAPPTGGAKAVRYLRSIRLCYPYLSGTCPHRNKVRR